MGARTVKGLLASHELHGKQTPSNSTRSRSTTTAICGSLRPCSQWGTCSGERTRVEGHSIAYLLHLRSLVWSKAKLYRDRKNSICSVDFFKKIKALLLGTWNHSSLFVTIQGHTQQQRSFWKNRKMGNRTIPVWAQLCIKNNNQITSTSRFYGRLDTFCNTLGVKHH